MKKNIDIFKKQFFIIFIIILKSQNGIKFKNCFIYLIYI